MRLEALPTPALILDVSRLRTNTERMATRMAAAGVRLRPHLKTAKSADVARLATADHFGGITVSTLAEATYFAAHGFDDITYAVGIVPSKLAHACELRGQGITLNLLVDSLEQVEMIAGTAAAHGLDFPVFMEIDCGQHRGGIQADDVFLLEMGRRINDLPSLSLAGVLTHAGQSYHARSIDEIVAIAEAERRAVVDAASRLVAAGLPCAAVSAGSTPTATFAGRSDGLTEMRPGVYMFFDLDQYGLGVCNLGDLALSVLATVISHSDRQETLLVDAGALALSKDRLAAEFLSDAGYGWVCDARSVRRIRGLRVDSVDQEHGYVRGDAASLPYDELPVGSLVRILPNHACMTAAAYERYYLVDSTADDPTEVIGEWDRVNGWFR